VKKQSTKKQWDKVDKPEYEAPVILSLGQSLRGKGASCGPGSGASDGCGNGTFSTWGCSVGNAASSGCVIGNSPS
jgi:hypothetical protein